MPRRTGYGREGGPAGDGICVGSEHGGLDGAALQDAPQLCPGLLEIPEQQR